MAELIWDGKYDAKRRKVAPVRYNLEFQTVETVNESAADRKRTLDFLTERREPEWRNRLIWGDKKYVLPSLLKEFAGKVNLIYIDPPFATGANFSYRARIPSAPPVIPTKVGIQASQTRDDANGGKDAIGSARLDSHLRGNDEGGRGDDEESDSAEFVKQPSMIEEKAYRDTWGRGIDSYLQWFYETALYLRELLADNGSIYVHLDWRLTYHARIILDEIFGSDRFVNDIIWHYGGNSVPSKCFPRKHDTLLLFAKGDGFTIKPDTILDPYSELTLARYNHEDEEGRRYKISALRDGKQEIVYAKDGRYADSVWNIPIPRAKDEVVGYGTQKPEALLERVISASSNPSDLVFDCFVGSGTTAVVAEKLGRRWIACDLSRFAIHTTRKRLLGIKDLKPFMVQNLGKYERQAWMGESFKTIPTAPTVIPTKVGIQASQTNKEFDARLDSRLRGNDTAEETRLDSRLRGNDSKELDYRRFIIGLYQAESVTGFKHLHGVKAGRMVHVGTVDAPVTQADVKNIALELKRAVGTGGARRAEADILYWDLAFDMNETVVNIAAEAGVKVRFFKIPREVMDPKAVEQGDVKFFELAALAVKTTLNKRELIVKLTDFMMPLEDVPEEVRKAVTHWSQWIDYWAVDWDFKEDTFHNQDQHYRTKKEPKLQLEEKHTYESPGRYAVMIKVIDIFGNDTTKLIQVEVR